nr:hypothetical protein [Wadden Sea poxvirus]
MTNIMDYIINNTPKGAIIFINYRFSITEHFNPSEYKHAAIYFGNLLPKSLRLLSKYTEYLAVEAVYKKGVRIIPLFDLFNDAVDITIYKLNDDININNKMSIAADLSINFIGMPYGLGNNRLYCFKLIANCFNLVGINIDTYKILGYDIILSQSFTKNNQWKKIFDLRSYK